MEIIRKKFKVVEEKNAQESVIHEEDDKILICVDGKKLKRILNETKVFISMDKVGKLSREELTELDCPLETGIQYWLIYENKVKDLNHLIGWVKTEDILRIKYKEEKEKRLFYESIISSLPSGINVIDMDAKIKFINDVGLRILEKKKSDLLNQSLEKVLPESSLDRVLKTRKPVLGVQVKMNNTDLISNYAPLYKENELIGAVSLFQKEEEFEAILRTLDSYKELSIDLKAIFDTSYDVIYVSDGEGMTLRVSSACQTLWGMKEEELIGTSIYDLEKKGVFYPSATRLVLERKEKVSIIQKTNTGRRLMVVATPIKNEEGKIIRVVNASRDITEVDQLHTELEEMKKLSEGYKKELLELREQNEIEKQIIHRSREMNDIINISRKIAEVDTTVLILGESGVGKEVIASFIHKSSERKDKPFIKINCGAIPENLLESELFGYDKGAFTGAKKEGKRGLFELANEGTLFLDEIGEMSVSLQVKLLRVLQEREITRIGGTKPIKINVRLITATNRDLKEEVEKGNFRQDLYYRINVVPIRISPLRERREDILPLIFHFTEHFNQKYMKNKKFSTEALESLQNYDWPGNVRELQNIIERLIVVTDKTVIERRHLPEGMSFDGKKSCGVKVYEIIPLKECVELAESQLLELAKKQFVSTTQIAQALGVNQSTISRKLQRIKIRLTAKNE